MYSVAEIGKDTELDRRLDLCRVGSSKKNLKTLVASLCNDGMNNTNCTMMEVGEDDTKSDCAFPLCPSPPEATLRETECCPLLLCHCKTESTARKDRSRINGRLLMIFCCTRVSVLCLFILDTSSCSGLRCRDPQPGITQRGRERERERRDS